MSLQVDLSDGQSPKTTSKRRKSFLQGNIPFHGVQCSVLSFAGERTNPGYSGSPALKRCCCVRFHRGSGFEAWSLQHLLLVRESVC